MRDNFFSRSVCLGGKDLSIEKGFPTLTSTFGLIPLNQLFQTSSKPIMLMGSILHPDFNERYVTPFFGFRKYAAVVASGNIPKTSPLCSAFIAFLIVDGASFCLFVGIKPYNFPATSTCQ